MKCKYMYDPIDLNDSESIAEAEYLGLTSPIDVINYARLECVCDFIEWFEDMEFENSMHVGHS